MDRIFEYTITSENAGKTLLDFLKEQSFSRHLITHLKKTDKGLTVNGEWAYVSSILKENDFLKITLIEEEGSENIVPVELPLTIVYEDEDIIILNKPAFMPIHPSINNYENTLANALNYYYKDATSPFVFRCVNRLDRDTTGLVLVAKNMYSSCVLSDMVRNREIHRTYMAVVEGKVCQNGTINAPIARKEDSVIERCVDFENGQSAITHYEVLKSTEDFSLLRIKLETGRTHQIRVHMKYIGHPLPGDFIYNPNMKQIKRQALHSYSLEFNHPVTKQPMRFEAEIPSDMQGIMNE